MRIPFVKASFIGSKTDLRSVINALKGTASFQMTAYEKLEKTNTDNERYEELVGLKKRLETALDIAKPDNKMRAETSYTELNNFSQYQQDAMRVVTQLEELQLQINHAHTTLVRNLEMIRGLGDYVNLPVAFSLLESGAYTQILCGILPTVKYQKLARDFAHANMNMQTFPSGKMNQIVIITTHRDDAQIAEVIHSYDFIPCPYNFDKTATAMIEVLKNENVELGTARAQLLENAKLLPEDARAIKSYYDYICNEADTIDIVAKTLQTQKYYILNGWVIQSEQENVKAKLGEVAPDIVCKFEPATADDDVPVLLKNSALVTPFRNVTEMYGNPGSRDIDPNPFVAFFYFVFFGMMIGDLGYALVLCAAVAAFIYFKKPSYGTKQFMLLFGICSVSAFVWGLLFGSVFGFKIGTQLIDPLDGAIYVMLLSLALGLIQLSVGITIDTWVKFRDGHYLSATLKGVPRIILFIGLMLFLPKVAFNIFGLPSVGFFNSINTVGMWITIIGAVGTMASNPYSVISYFNDTVSYVRLFALSLVGAVIANVGNIIGGMMFGIPFVGYPIGVLVAILFHVFNLGLGLLSAYIHGARLQFIEFFSKFYTGDGVQFSPVGGNLRYTIIKGGN
ncbi:MAG: hypothetical protein LBG88_01445 [Christensenellaceae bacterium]|jgi:V/A-type H+-transporting ATPase subunit I|nr:hypothetical protein [Christensenellaceae bacterium]